MGFPTSQIFHFLDFEIHSTASSQNRISVRSRMRKTTLNKQGVSFVLHEKKIVLARFGA